MKLSNYLPKRLLNNSLKVLLSLVIIFSFLIAQPKQKVEAAIPFVPIVVGALSSVIADYFVDLGIGFVTDQVAKSTANNIASKIYNKYPSELNNMTFNKYGKSLTTKAAGYVTAEIIDEIGDLKEEILDDGSVYSYSLAVSHHEADYVTIGNYNFQLLTSDVVFNTQQRINLFNAFISNSSSRVSEDGSLVYFNFCIETCTERYFGKSYANGDNGYLTLNLVFEEASNRMKILPEARNNSGAFVQGYSFYLNYTPGLYNDVPDTIDGYKMGDVIVHGDYINRYDTDDKTIEFLKAIDWGPSLGELELNINVSDNPELSSLMDAIEDNTEINSQSEEYDDLLSKLTQYLDTVMLPYTNKPIQESSGITDEQMSLIQTSAMQICTQNGSVITCSNSDPVDTSILAYIRNAYEYGVNGINTAVSNLNGVVTGTAGLIAFYEHIFSWLPGEMSVFLTGGLLLMIGLRVIRR